MQALASARPVPHLPGLSSAFHFVSACSSLSTGLPVMLGLPCGTALLFQLSLRSYLAWRLSPWCPRAPQGQGLTARCHPGEQAPLVMDDFCLLYPFVLRWSTHSLGWNEVAFCKRPPRKVLANNKYLISDTHQSPQNNSLWKVDRNQSIQAGQE